MKNINLSLLAFSVSLATAFFPVRGQDFLTNGLVAYFPFSGNADDTSGNGNHGAASSVTYATDRFNRADSAASFEGDASSYVRINSLALNFTTDFTVSVWVNFTANLGSQNPRIFSTAGYEVGTQTTSSRRLAYFNNTTFSAGAFTIYSSNTISAGIWWHLVGVRAGNEMILYVNGELAGSLSTTQPPDYSRGSVPEVGGNSGSAADNYGGLIDDLRLYSRALSAEEVASLYRRESPPIVALSKAVKPVFSNLVVGTTYQLQVSGDMNTWTNEGSSFTATDMHMTYPQYWDVDNWAELFFRLWVVP